MQSVKELLVTGRNSKKQARRKEEENEDDDPHTPSAFCVREDGLLSKKSKEMLQELRLCAASGKESDRIGRVYRFGGGRTNGRNKYD